MYCEKCKVTVRGGGGGGGSGAEALCPLCQGRITGEGTGEVFPVLNTEKPEGKLLRLMFLIMLVASVVCITINVSMPSTGYWSLLVIAGFFSFDLSFYVLISKRKNIYKTILWEVAILSVIAVLWDISTGFRGWSTDFVIPITCTAAMAAMAVIAQITHLKIEDYIVYLIIDGVFGLISLLLILLDVTNYRLPSLICIGSSVISFGALMIFEGPAMTSEIRRRLHL